MPTHLQVDWHRQTVEMHHVINIGSTTFNSVKIIDKIYLTLTNTPVLTMLKTSASLVNNVAKELNDTPRPTAKTTPVANPICKYWNKMTSTAGEVHKQKYYRCQFLE